MSHPGHDSKSECYNATLSSFTSAQSSINTAVRRDEMDSRTGKNHQTLELRCWKDELKSRQAAACRRQRLCGLCLEMFPAASHKSWGKEPLTWDTECRPDCVICGHWLFLKTVWVALHQELPSDHRRKTLRRCSAQITITLIEPGSSASIFTARLPWPTYRWPESGLGNSE